MPRRSCNTVCLDDGDGVDDDDDDCDNSDDVMALTHFPAIQPVVTK